MKVILRKDIENLGKKYDIKDVSDGYARNFLLKNNLAKIASEKEIKRIESIKKKEMKDIEKEKEINRKLAKEIEKMKVEIKVKVGEKKELYESVGVKKIVDKMKELGVEIDKDAVKLEEPIKTLGDFEVNIVLSHKIGTKVKVIIEEE